MRCALRCICVRAYLVFGFTRDCHSCCCCCCCLSLRTYIILFAGLAYDDAFKIAVRTHITNRKHRKKWQGDNNKHTLCFIFRSTLSVACRLHSSTLSLSVMPPLSYYCCERYFFAHLAHMHTNWLNGVNCGNHEQKKKNCTRRMLVQTIYLFHVPLNVIRLRM